LTYWRKYFFVFLALFLFDPNLLLGSNKSDISVLDIYGNRSDLIDINKLKKGDFLKTNEKSSLLKINSNKFCFSENTSIKINEIDIKKNKFSFYLINGKYIKLE
jgi:hypothetical protein